jgi:glycosyltransferase involved in cell wall biosynthesis
MRIVAPSLWMLNRIAEQELKRFGLSHIPYGIDLDHFKYISGGREYFNLPNDQPVILFSAWYETKRAVGARKGLADLAAAFLEHVLPAVPNAILAVAGESFAPNHPSVRPLGLVGVESVPRLLSAADVYVLPTLADNFPYTILEAMACGTPVIATNVGGIPEQIVDGHNGLIVPPSSPIALGKAIVDVLLNTENAKLMGLNGRKRAVERYSMNSFVDSYERLFNLLSKSDQHRLDAR